MGKKIEETEVKKECPSCGLGVAMDAKICEFCGWDFEEEDEWILQIEKLERDLLVEKQRAAPGSVDEKIESTLHSPSAERADIQRSSPRASPPQQQAPPERVEPPMMAQRPAPRPRPTVSFDEVIEPEEAEPETEEPVPVRETSAPPPVPAKPRVRRVRSVKPKEQAPQPEPARAEPPKRTRVVRKVKSN